jgi:hypothetical protein
MVDCTVNKAWLDKLIVLVLKIQCLGLCFVLYNGAVDSTCMSRLFLLCDHSLVDQQPLAFDMKQFKVYFRKWSFKGGVFRVLNFVVHVLSKVHHELK